MPTAGTRARRWCWTRSAASGARCVSSGAPTTRSQWSGSSSRRSARTAACTRKATATRSWAWSGSATRLTQEGTEGEPPRTNRSVDPAERRVALPVPPALSRRRAIARHGGDEQRVPAPPSGAGAPARGQVRLHLLPWWTVVLPVPGADRDRRVPDVLLRAVSDVRVLGHPAHPVGTAVRPAHPQHPSLGGAPDGVLRVP